MPGLPNDFIGAMNMPGLLISIRKIDAKKAKRAKDAFLKSNGKKEKRKAPAPQKRRGPVQVGSNRG